jgi:prepilin-type N-terminal cleavage/methylation domain-containing protein
MARRTGGFTLIEMMVVLALIALIAAFAVPGISSYFKVSLNSAARELASTIKETYNSSAMSGRVYRVVYDMKENSYWCESGPQTFLLDTNESREREERRKRFAKTTDAKPAAAKFSIDKTVTRKKITLPRGVVFEDIITEQSPEPITGETTYTHFFPHGMTEQTIIHLKDSSDHHATLVISPIVGRTRLIDRYVNKDEALEATP